ncbi:hypothetical protein ADIARSV_3167 [Arcticibacter svalbardensis MN12-7]|uniref:Glycosyltransferase 2-like domain-containing protein n=1 Tax=Arcticibacter svalbardensis MN12-7 TaxID=1150600 RepID=R9GPP7_9SPHI|nr:glycosyltransferase [Arcticibacter svalbardensis]EOR93658.1 hypothetical protein ADIARSV_3167 [Arcticibacter svalbardensis MN12-7]
MPLSGTRVCVVVPVRNEAENIWDTLDALRLQTDNKGHKIDPNLYEVLVLVNNCTDASFAITKEFQYKYPKFRLHIDQIQLPDPLANIGTVRSLLMDEAYRRFMLISNEEGIIASTDGDTIADQNWLYYIMSEIDKGNDAVGGRILALQQSDTARLYHLRDVTYRCLLAQAESLIDPQLHDPMPRHFQYFGASLAVTCKMYQLVGRLPQVPNLEDMAFHQALIRHDAKIRKSFNVKVYTSSRIQGRVDIGFSEQLRQWTLDSAANKTQQVESVEIQLRKFKLRKRLRKCWLEFQNRGLPQQELIDLASLLKFKIEWLHTQFTTAPYFGILWEAVEKALHQAHWQQSQRPQPIMKAIHELRTFIHDHQATVFQIDPDDNFLFVYKANA